MKKNNLLILISSIIAIYAIIGFVAIPNIAKPQIEKAINENITQKATLEKVTFNPFLLKFSLENLKIFTEEETTVSVDKLFIDFSIIKSLDERHISFKDLQLVNPYVNVIEYEDGTLNLQKLAKQSEPKPQDTKEESSSSNIKFQIYRTILDNARIKFTKLIKDDEPFKLDIDKLNYTFYDMGTYRNTLASHSLKILINKHSELVINGGLRLDPFKMHGNVELKNFKPYEFLTYKKNILNFELNKEAYLNFKFGYKVNAKDKLKLEIDNAFLDIKHVDIKQKDNSILSLDHFALENLNLDYPQNLVTIDSIFLNKFNTKVISDKEGKLNLANLIIQESQEEHKEKVEEEKVLEQSEKQMKEAEVIVKQKKEPTTQDNPWKVVLKELQIKDSNVSFNDLKNALFVDTKNINLDLANFKLNGKDFTLEKVAINKPTITLDDKKNRLSIVNKELQIAINNLSSKDSTINLANVRVDLASVDLKDKKNAMTIFADKLSLNAKNLIQNSELITLEQLSLTNPKLTFKDNKNKLHVFTKKTDISVNTLKKEKENITINSIGFKNPSVYVRDYKNSLKIVTNKVALDANTLSIKNDDIKLNKLSLKTPSLKFNDLKNKLDITTKNINISASKTSMVKKKLKVALLSLAKPTVYLVDNKNNQTIVADRISLKINGVENFKNATKVSKVSLYEPKVTIKDKTNKTDIIAKNIAVSVHKISHKNNKLKIVKSNINKPYLSITLGKKPALKKEEGEKPKEKKVAVKKVVKKKSDFQFDIGPVNIKDMKMTFEDKNLPIPFKTDVSKLNGKFSRLNSNSSKPTKLELEGKVDEYGYTKITGTVDINDVKLLTDTNLLFKNIAIKNFTPYSGKFIGRQIDSGKLDLDLKYNIKKSDLNAENGIIISNIKLGKKVESPDAVNLPLELAIALLENSEGVIDLELPVSGNVDDPKFSIAPIVWKVFTNLIVKAITAPFSLLASVFGFDEEKIKSLEFEFGKSDILVSEKETLDNISKILSKKKKLAINIKPTYDPVKDKIALQDMKFDKFLEKKMKKIHEGDEYKEALEDLYEDIKKVKPLDEVEKQFISKDKKGKEIFDNDAYVEYLRKFLANKQTVTQKELLTLANTRVTNITNYLTKEKKVQKEAIKIKDMTKQDKQKAKWVVFDLDVSTK